MAAKTLADGKIKLLILPTRPANIKAPTVLELTATDVIDASCNILKSDYRISAADSQTVEEAALCEEGTAAAWGRSNYEGNVTSFRYFDPLKPGSVDTTGDQVFQALKNKGVTLWLVERETGKTYDQPIEAGDEVSIYEVQADNPQKPGNQTEGYIKRVHKLTVKAAAEHVAVAA